MDAIATESDLAQAISRMRIAGTDTQRFEVKSFDNLKNSMNFTHEEAKVSTPVSACGIVQGVAPTVRFICCLAITNFINFVEGKPLKKQIIATPFILGEESVMAF